MYFRLYPSRQNSIFRYLNFNKAGDIIKVMSDNINSGANPVMELMDGKGESKLMFAFEIPDWLKSKLQTFSYKANLQLWDAGTLWEPAIKLKNVKLESFEEDFVEGDGYSFLHPENKVGVSNWVYRDSVNKWENVIFTPVLNYHMNRINEDFNFDVTTSIQSFVAASKNPHYSLSVDNREASTSIYRKFIHSNYTKTVFKPYIEFEIDDTILDKSSNFYATEANKVYLVNKKGVDFTGVVTAEVTVDGVTTTSTATKERTAVYSLTITPANVPQIGRKDICSIVWKIGGVAVQKQNIDVKSPNIFSDPYDETGLFFYPVTTSTHNTARVGDILPFEVISEIRGQGIVVLDTYEYKVTSADGFEIVPWQKVSVYRNKMYFNINTLYFFPEQTYEVWVRNKKEDSVITSSLTHKFKLLLNDKSHLRELSASPYYSREQFFQK